jgi:outer membrane protein TolC
MITKNFFFIVVFVFVSLKCLSQISIIPELSSSYVQKLIDTAVANSPKIKSDKIRVDIAKSNISKTNLSLFESVSVSYVYEPGQASVNSATGSTTLFSGLQTGLFLNLGTLIERPTVIKQAKYQLLITKNDQDESYLNLATDVKKRYYVYILNFETLKIQTKALEDADQLLKDVKYRFEKGEVPYDTYNKAQEEFTTRQVTKLSAEAGLFSAKADLEQLLGTKLENIR